MKKILIGIFLAIVVLFFSCKKDSGNGMQDRTEDDNSYIKSLIIIDTAYFGDRDTLFKFIFEYDGNKRISRIQEFSNRSFGVYLFIADLKFTYSGSDTLPSVLYSLASYVGPVYDTVYLSYNNGVIVRDSSAYGVPGAPTAFVLFNFQLVNNNMVYGKFIDSVEGHTSSRINVHSYVNWQNGNLLIEKDTFYIPVIPSYPSESKEYTYDQKPNPFRRALLNFPTTAFYSSTSNVNTMAEGSWYLKYFTNQSINNRLTELSNPGNVVTTWDYTYGPNGMPAKSIRYREGTMYKFIYSYITL